MSSELVIKLMEEVRNDMNEIKKIVAENATSQAILSTNLNNHIAQEESLDQVKEDAYRKVTVAYVIIGLLITIIMFIAGYKVGDSKNLYTKEDAIKEQRYEGN
jgi:uncharacterized membrane protein